MVAGNPSLSVGEIADITPQLHRGVGEIVYLRIGRVLGLDREIEGLPQVLRQEMKAISAHDRRAGVGSLEHLVASFF
jgi:hypothetical protein